MRSAIVGFVVGAAWLQMQASLPHYFIIVFLFGAACLLAVLARRRSLHRIRISLFAGMGVLLGFVWAALFAQYYLAAELPKNMEGRDITIVGTIDSMPSYF